MAQEDHQYRPVSPYVRPDDRPPHQIVPVYVTVPIEMTPEDFEKIRKAAHWTHGENYARYMIDAALGRLPRGC